MFRRQTFRYVFYYIFLVFIHEQSDEKLLIFGTCLLQRLYYLNSIPEIEDGYEGERKDAMMKIDSLTSIVKMFELKTKNFQDQSKLMLLFFQQ